MTDATAPDREAFLRLYGGVYERSPWVAERSYEHARGIHDPERLADIFARSVDQADKDTQLALIRAHPDLADRAAIAGELGAASSEEQQSAGIDRCTPEEFKRFKDLNRRYKDKFGFPFVMAVRRSSREEILAAFEARLGNTCDAEFDKAIAEIHKIAKLRLQASAK
jgi:2-oxo-4-hydroxy-4-carboxy-5-ureidoimidazoline decarboxylase